jgi:hypothetical protein
MFKVATAKITRLTLVPLLVFWVAGTGCLIGCEKLVLAAIQPGHQSRMSDVIDARESCAAKKSHDCCSKQSKVAKVPASENPQFEFMVPSRSSDSFGCPLAANRAAILGKAGSIPGPTALATIRLSGADDAITRFVSRLEINFIPANRGHTYLRCCVFLI